MVLKIQRTLRLSMSSLKLESFFLKTIQYFNCFLCVHGATVRWLCFKISFCFNVILNQIESRNFM